MHNQKLRGEMETFYLYLQKIVRDDQLTIPSNNYDLVLDIMPTSGNNLEVQWSYYYACHETRCLFWLEDYDGSYMTYGLEGIESPAHVSTLHPPSPASFTNLVCRAPVDGPLLVCRLSPLLAYHPQHQCRLVRTHWCLFPVVFDGRRLPTAAHDELIGTLSFGCVGESVYSKSRFHESVRQR